MDYLLSKKEVKTAFLSKIRVDDEASFRFFSEADRENRILFDQASDGSFKPKESSFPYILYSWTSFGERLGPLIKKAKSFVDVGCGAGDKLAIAQALNPKCQVTGIELSPFTSMWAAALVPDALILNVDAFRVDFSNWDLIYMYYPIPDSNLMEKLARHVMSGMREGSTMVIVGWRNAELEKYCADFRPDTAVVYKKPFSNGG